MSENSNEEDLMRSTDECTSATVPNIDKLRETVLGRSERDEQEIVSYFEWQSNKGRDDDNRITVRHLEMVKTEERAKVCGLGCPRHGWPMVDRDESDKPVFAD